MGVRACAGRKANVKRENGVVRKGVDETAECGA